MEKCLQILEKVKHLVAKGVHDKSGREWDCLKKWSGMQLAVERYAMC